MYKYYFVSYAHRYGFGNIYVRLKSELFIANSVAKLIESKSCSTRGVTVLYYKQVTKEHYDEVSK